MYLGCFTFKGLAARLRCEKNQCKLNYSLSLLCKYFYCIKWFISNFEEQGAIHHEALRKCRELFAYQINLFSHYLLTLIFDFQSLEIRIRIAAKYRGKPMVCRRVEFEIVTSKKSPHCNENELSLPHLRSNIWYKFVIPQYIIEKQICTAIPQNLMYFDGYFGRRCMPQCAGKENTLKVKSFQHPS